MTDDRHGDPDDVRDGWRLIRAQLRLQRGGLAIGVFAGVCWTAAKVTVPKIVETAIDDGMEAGDADVVVRCAWAIVVVALVSAFFTGLRRYSAFREARRTEAMLRDRLFAHLSRLHFSFHDGQQTGQLMSRANNDLQQIQNAVVLVPLAVANLTTIVAVFVLLVLIDPILTMLALGSPRCSTCSPSGSPGRCTRRWSRCSRSRPSCPRWSRRRWPAFGW